MLVPEYDSFCGGSLSQLGPESIDVRGSGAVCKRKAPEASRWKTSRADSYRRRKPEPEPLVSMSCAKLFLQPSHAVELPNSLFEAHL